MATDRYLISLASSCIGSFRGEPVIESQASQSIQSAGGVHGLSTLIGALRQLLCSNGLELSDAKHIFRVRHHDSCGRHAHGTGGGAG